MKNIYHNPSSEYEEAGRRWFKNVKLIGEIDDGTSIYIEDYAYTYLKQYAKSNLSYELCAVLIGEHNKEIEQITIYGVIPVDYKLLEKGVEWIGENVLGAIEDERKCYFPEGNYVGWMHTQPGYGLMPTTREMLVHKDIFGEDCILMLMDPFYNIETFFLCKEDKFYDKKGFCIYYEKNEEMQQYMEDNCLLGPKKQEISDKVVDDFRELGAKWKQEVELKRRTNMFISVVVVGFLLTVALIAGLQSQQKRIIELENEVVNIYKQYSEK